MSFTDPVDREPSPMTPDQKFKERLIALASDIAKPQRQPLTEGAVWLSVFCARISAGKAGPEDAREAADGALAAYKKRFPTTP